MYGMSIAYKISAYNRGRKWRLFWSVFKPARRDTVLDIGFSNNEYSSTDNYLEKHYPYPERITAVSVEDSGLFSRRYPQVRAVTYNGQRLPFADESFDIGWSNAVVEHVGPYEKQVRFVREAVRVSKRLMLTTPNRWFPIEVHSRLPFVHWLPKQVCDRLLRLFGKGWAAGEYMYLLGLKDIRRILADANVTRYRIVKNRLLGVTLDFVIIIEHD